MTVGELREALAGHPDYLLVVLCDDQGNEWAVLPDLTGEVVLLPYTRVGLVCTGLPPRIEP